MKIAVSTLPFRTWPLERVLQCCCRNGYSALEIRMDFHPWSCTALVDDHYLEAYSQIRSAGLHVSNLGSGIVLAKDSEEEFQKLIRLFEIADCLRTKGVRIMLGHIRLNRLWPESPLDRDGILRWLVRADQLARQSGKEVWIETHNEFATGRSLSRIFQEVPLFSTRVIWDVMHPLEQGETVEETLDFLGNRLVHVHIKDGVPWDDPNQMIWKYTPIGEGVIPISKIIRLLRRRGYDGYYSLEWESAWRKELAELDCDEMQIRDFPGCLLDMNHRLPEIKELL